jgi:hypothetical protein
VRHVEQRRGLARCAVLVDDRAVLHRHREARERHHPAAEPLVQGRERRASQLGHRPVRCS